MLDFNYCYYIVFSVCFVFTLSLLINECYREIHRRAQDREKRGLK